MFLCSKKLFFHIAAFNINTFTPAYLNDFHEISIRKTYVQMLGRWQTTFGAIQTALFKPKKVKEHLKNFFERRQGSGSPEIVVL